MSYNRNLKRVAGPGFHVNVRYDDHLIAQCKNNITSNFKPLSHGRRLQEVYDIKEQELLVARNKQLGANYFDGYTHCFSAVNYYPLKDKGLNQNSTPDQIAEALLKQVRFIGIATTEYVPTAGFQEQGFVAQVGGVVTVLNESADTIYPGEKVALGLNLSQSRRIVRDKGIPTEKIRFTIVKAGSSDAMIAQAETNAGGPGATAKDIIKAYQDLQERVIGKSYSFARPGDRLEIGLQPRTSY